VSKYAKSVLQYIILLQYFAMALRTVLQQVSVTKILNLTL